MLPACAHQLACTSATMRSVCSSRRGESGFLFYSPVAELQTLEMHWEPLHTLGTPPPHTPSVHVLLREHLSAAAQAVPFASMVTAHLPAAQRQAVSACIKCCSTRM
jgi:hypothetical protein